MSGGHDLGMMFPIKSGRAKVDESDLGVLDSSHVSSLMGMNEYKLHMHELNLFVLHTYLLGVKGDLPVGGDKEDIFRLQVGVGQLAVVEELDRVAELIGDVSDLVQSIGMIVVLFLWHQS